MIHDLAINEIMKVYGAGLGDDPFGPTVSNNPMGTPPELGIARIMEQMIVKMTQA